MQILGKEQKEREREREKERGVGKKHVSLRILTLNVNGSSLRPSSFNTHTCCSGVWRGEHFYKLLTERGVFEQYVNSNK